MPQNLGPGLIHIYTGEGKGKTTAAMGLACRAAGWGWLVSIVQFFKFVTGERKFFEAIPNVAYAQFTHQASYFRKYSPADFRTVQDKFYAFWEAFLEGFERAPPDLLVLDEASYLFSDKVCEAELLAAFLDSKPAGTEIVMTGRDFPNALMERADYVTEMRLVKHPYKDRELGARRGIEF